MVEVLNILNDFFADENKLLFYKEDKSKSHQIFLDREWGRQVEQRKTDVEPKIIEILKDKNQQWMKLEDAITEIILSLANSGYDLGYLRRPEYRLMMIELFKKRVIQAESLGRKGEPTLESRVRIVRY